MFLRKLLSKQDMFPLKKTKRIFFITLIILILAVVSDIFFISFVYKKRNNVEKLRKDFFVEMKKEKQLNTIKNIIKDTEDEQLNLRQCFIESEEIVNFIKLIESKSKEAGIILDIKSVGVSNTETINATQVETLVVDFMTQGSWDSTFVFLSLIENIRYNIIVDKMSVNKFTDNLTKKDTWKSNFTIKAIKI